MPLPALNIRQNIDWSPIQNVIAAWQQRKEKEQIGNALADALAGGGQINPEQLRNVLKLNPQVGMNVAQMGQRTQENQRERDKEAATQLGGAAFHIARQPESARPALYDEARKMMEIQYPDFMKRNAEMIPPDYATAAPKLEAWVAKVTPIAEQVRMATQQTPEQKQTAEIDKENRQFGRQKELEGVKHGYRLEEKKVSMDGGLKVGGTLEKIVSKMASGEQLGAGEQQALETLKPQDKGVVDKAVMMITQDEEFKMEPDIGKKEARAKQILEVVKGLYGEKKGSEAPKPQKETIIVNPKTGARMRLNPITNSWEPME